MEALIYNESPIAEYLEGDAIPFEAAEPPSPLPCARQTYAPRGLPRLRDRLRTFRQTAASVTDVANEQFLERFRYVIVASQLLADDPKPRRQLLQHDQPFAPHTLSFKGACITAGISFSVAWSLHLLQRGYRTSRSHCSTWSEICIYSLLFIGGYLVLLYFARRQYLEFVRQSAGSTLGKVVSNSHNYDSIAAEALRFIQEVEVVSRGYEISHPLPPVSRLEDKNSQSRCRDLRTTLGITLTASIVRCVEAHNAVQPFVRDLDLQRYHDIYEVSMQDYTDAVAFANDSPLDSRDTLKELRFLFRLHLIARKVFLCDLLALHSGSTWYNVRQWRLMCHVLEGLDGALSQASQELHSAVVREEYGEDCQDAVSEEAEPAAEQSIDATTPQKRHTKAQLRRFEAVANAIRSLNAKIHLLREEINSLKPKDDSTLSTTITGHYEQLGAEIRNALVEWEKGRNTMFLNVGTESDNRFSRASSGLRSPASPSPSSLGGLTVVDGGPAEALRLLSGGERSPSDGAGLDEEVFEAVALPRKRMSWAPMSREEKLNRLQEDRRKRATFQEHAENTTNMLRELQMVIKHRPLARSDTRITSI
ncbi:uncharacterized protein A1O5_11990 [Cladophialophora psammophila CBS 110553]|uniref:Vezatin n=1 Tax=Cladophialophora psammophila CBS 110553 TaxID=1182543 RepID=W9VZS8_9EURO|nr:uncharacterized protein A1O5_11990 [Cladophialophora psammophila CBS 110553]EXJ61198.1 hypothetical protein A1O5_11990 [Cladophialophora psammophila CBS 110553]